MLTIAIINLILLQSYSKEILNCDKEIEFNLQQGETLLSALPLKNIVSNAILTNEKLLIIDNEFKQTVPPVILPKDNNEKWYKITTDEKGENIFIIGQRTDLTNSIILINCSVEQCNIIGNAQKLPLIKDKIQDWKVVSNTLIASDIYVLYFFQIIITNDNWTIQNTKYQLDATYFGFTWSAPRKFDLQPFSEQGGKFYNMFILTRNVGFWLNLLYSNKQLSPIERGAINLYTEDFDYATMYDCQFIQSATNYDDYIQTSIQLISEGKTQKILSINYTTFELKSYSVKQGLVQFKTWTPRTDSFYKFGNYETLEYTDNGIAAIAFYDISQVINPYYQIEIQTYRYLPNLVQYLSFVSIDKDQKYYFNYLSDVNVFTQCATQQEIQE